MNLERDYPSENSIYSTIVDTLSDTHPLRLKVLDTRAVDAEAVVLLSVDPMSI